MIPKLIHWCWFGNKPMPQTNKDCVKTWIKALPANFQIKFWNEENFDVTQCRFSDEAFATKQFAFVSDYARWKILHQYGGVYLDSDVSMLRDISPLLDQRAFGGVVNGNFFASGLILAAEPQFHICAEMVKMYESLKFCTKNGEPIYVNCVLRETELMEKYGFDMDKAATIQDCGGMNVYPKQYFCGYNPESGEVYADGNSYCLHQFTGTWMPEWMRQNVCKTNAGYKRHYDTIYNKYTYQ